MTGQILGGALISANLAGVGWRAIFLINVPVGALESSAVSASCSVVGLTGYDQCLKIEYRYLILLATSFL